ncbi:MAG: nitrite/sulfite reductase [Motiliproteus sp.]
MYQYDDYDRQVVSDRVQQFKGQMDRYLQGELSEEVFLPLRLQNGLYVQKHAPMLRVAVPYGMLSAQQLRKVSVVSRRYDRGYCHITTRQNIQFNWVEMDQVPTILEQLLDVDMHAIQTSGNCIRNTTCDPLAGVAKDEAVDPRPYCEIIRQWSMIHPEFAFLPRKFKIAVIGASEDRASIQLHDIGLRLIKNKEGNVGFQVWVGGGLGRTPVLASVLREFLPQRELLAYLKAVLRVFNLHGRRDNKYKARIKILVKALGVANFKEQVEDQFNQTRSAEYLLDDNELKHAQSFFQAPPYEPVDAVQIEAELAGLRRHNLLFDRWVAYNVTDHKVPGYAAVTLSLKSAGQAPGDISASQLDWVAELSERYSFGEVRTSQQQNLILPDVKIASLYALWRESTQAELATPTIGTAADIVCCPGADFCNLATARSIPVSSAIQQRFTDLDNLYDLGKISLRISGCINACAHHHIANIGILGVDKGGQEYYQITLGGRSGSDAQLGKVLGPSVPADAVADAMTDLFQVYLNHRNSHAETFVDTYQRIGRAPFKEQVYA